VVALRAQHSLRLLRGNSPPPRRLPPLSLHDALPISEAAVVLIHHKGKGNGSRERGSSALRGAVDVMIEVGKDKELITLKCTKSRSEEHTSALQARENLVCRRLREKKERSLAASSESG